MSQSRSVSSGSLHNPNTCRMLLAFSLETTPHAQGRFYTLERLPRELLLLSFYGDRWEGRGTCITSSRRNLTFRVCVSSRRWTLMKSGTSLKPAGIVEGWLTCFSLPTLLGGRTWELGFGAANSGQLRFKEARRCSFCREPRREPSEFCEGRCWWMPTTSSCVSLEHDNGGGGLHARRRASTRVRKYKTSRPDAQVLPQSPGTLPRCSTAHECAKAGTGTEVTCSGDRTWSTLRS